MRRKKEVIAIPFGTRITNEHSQRPDVKERNRDRQREYYKRPDVKERVREYMREYYKKYKRKKKEEKSQ